MIVLTEFIIALQLAVTPVEVDPCELVANPQEYSGRMVQVRGKLYWTREGGGLVFPHCMVSLKTDGHSWEKGIALRLVEEPSANTTSLLTKHVNEIMHPLLPSVGGGDIVVEVTAYGRVMTRKHYKATPIKENLILFNGFGPFQRYPIELSESRIVELRLRELKRPR